MPLRTALPMLMLFDIAGMLSTKPEACVAALPSAHAVRRVSRPSSLAIAAAEPNTPHVLVM